MTSSFSHHYFTKEELTTPRSGMIVIVDNWWWEKDGLILDWRFGKRQVMQCNRDLSVMEYLKSNPYYAGHTPVQIPLAFYPNQSYDTYA